MSEFVLKITSVQRFIDRDLKGLILILRVRLVVVLAIQHQAFQKLQVFCGFGRLVGG
ncbi:hypothetical protein [Chamaesiphon minutus]|uniref:hypothetical protein n=1 Tax=Chamaesiphon minutus TaxID=1173032 RepID=UPI00031F5FD1|nr:hypothetical protein [Chamaesiphon minutus]